MKNADAIAMWLDEQDIRVGFGIIGGGNLALWDAITRRGRTELIGMHHEQAAAMAASYYARSLGRIGFALVTTGAGSSNALTGVIAAHMDGTPLLVISGNESSAAMGSDCRVWGVQGYASSEVAAHITKRAWRATWAVDARANLDTLSKIALEAPQGPVWLDIPKDIQNAQV